VVYSKHSVTAYCVELKTSGVQQIHWWVKNTVLHVLKMNGVKHVGGLAAAHYFLLYKNCVDLQYILVSTLLLL
jgi:hypothetical protein